MEKDSWILAGVLLVAGYGLARSLTSCTPMIARGQRLFLVGDSLAVGMSRHFRNLAEQSGITYASATKSGTRTEQWAQGGLASQLSTFRPSLTLVSLGTNDSVATRPDFQHLENIKKLVSIIHSAGSEVYWILPPTLPWEHGFSELVTSQNIPAFDSRNIKIPMGPDGIHPTGAGYAGWAGLVWKSITCGDTTPQQLSGPAPTFVRRRPATSLVKPSGVFRPRRRR